MSVQTGTILDEIVENTRAEVAARKSARPLDEARAAADAAAAPPPRDFVLALRRDTVALIAEVKHASPSRGVLIEPFDPVALGLIYAQHGAAAISVLTDERYFQGHLDHMRAVRETVTVPVLRKDFMVDAYQVYEARAAGADAVLLIAAVLDDAEMSDLHALAADLGMTPLVEVHNEPEMERALKLNPRALGINNRDLKTFTVDTGLTARLVKLIPNGVVAVAESGMKTAADVRMMGDSGADAVLIGEGLVAAPDIAAQVALFSAQPKGNPRG
jgi:indole-3-glycerol phosphate synthase